MIYRAHGWCVPLNVFLSVACISCSVMATEHEHLRRPFGLDADTVALFHFDESADVASDNAVGGEPDGVMRGASAWIPIDHPAANPEFGGSLLLVDQGASMTWKDSPRGDLPETYTIEFWIRPANEASGTIIGQTYPSSPWKSRLSHLTFADHGRIVHRNAEGPGDQGTGSSAWVATLQPVLRPGMWTHVAVVNDKPRDILRIFIDGHPVTTARHEHGHGRGAQPHDPKDISGDFAVGAGLYENHQTSFIGVLDELRISSVARYPLANPLPLEGKRVLFLDELYVDTKTNLKRVLHPPRKHQLNPIFKREKPWEKWVTGAGQILYDPKTRLYKRWYRSCASLGPKEYDDTGTEFFHCYATSKDGLSWVRPNLSLVEFRGSRDNNIIPLRPHVIPRYHEPGAKKQFAGLSGRGGENLYYSDDGLSWEPHPDNPVASGPSFGMTALFYDPTQKLYCAYGQGWIRLPRPGEPSRGSRVVTGRFSTDLIHWTIPRPLLVPTPEDPPGMEFYAMGGYMDGDLLIGLPWAFRSSHGRGNDPPTPRQWGPIDTELAVSRDGTHWTRVAPREAFIPRGKEGEWDAGMILTGGNVLWMGDELYFYYSSWDSDHGVKQSRAAGGLAILQRDRYLSLTPGDQERGGRLTTRPLVLRGGELWVNADARDGEIRVALRAVDGEAVPGYTADDCAAITSDTGQHPVSWKGQSHLPNEGVFKLEFTLSGRAHLYGFRNRD